MFMFEWFGWLKRKKEGFEAYIECETCQGRGELADANFEPYTCPTCNGAGGQWVTSVKQDDEDDGD